MSKPTLSDCPNCRQGQPEIIKAQSSTWDQACIICPTCGYSVEIGRFITKALRNSSPNKFIFDLSNNWEIIGYDAGELVLEVSATTMAEIETAASISRQFHPLFASCKITNPSPTSTICMVCNNPYLEPVLSGEYMACNAGHYKIKKIHYLIQYLERLGFLTTIIDDKTVGVKADTAKPHKLPFGATFTRHKLVPVANIWIGHRQHKTKPEVFLLSKPEGFTPSTYYIYSNLLNSMKSHFSEHFEILEKKE